jgi:competence protein ComEC
MEADFAGPRLAKPSAKGQPPAKGGAPDAGSGLLAQVWAQTGEIAGGQRDRWPLWLPVALGLGAGVYFALPAEPAPTVAAMVLVAGAAAAVATIMGWRRASMALAGALLLGFGLARMRAEHVATPVLARPLVAHLTGRIDSVEPREQGVRLVLSDIRSGAFTDPPRRVRVALRVGGAGLRAGDRVSLTASLAPPSAPVAPGAADFGRAAFFQSIGAVGFAYGRAHAVPALHPPGIRQRLENKVQNLRAAMTARIHARLPGSTGAIAAALITGTRGGISDEDEAALRDAGLAHVLAIAGLHMALVGGGLFWAARALLAAFPSLALRYPIKKWAAGAALGASAFYLVISGGAAPAVRAFVMLATALTAVLLDRPALTMRGVALAATVLLVLRPEAIVEPGFQMSFAAVAALVAVAEWQAARPHVARGALGRYLRAIAMTSLVGSLATLPYALFHFGRATHYAVLGNLIAMPVMGFWVMPAAALSVMLMPLGLDGPALLLLGKGIDVMLALGGWVAGLPGAVSLAPAMPLSALLAISTGGLWLAIWRGRRRWFGLGGLAAGVVLAAVAPRPDMLVSPDGETVAIRGGDGLLHFPVAPRDRFAAREWLRRDGDARALKQAAGMTEARCDGVGCVARRRGSLIALSKRPEALADDCAQARILVTALTMPPAVPCKGPALVIDGAAAEKAEGFALSLSPLATQSVRQARGQRPWVPRLNSGG